MSSSCTHKCNDLQYEYNYVHLGFMTEPTNTYIAISNLEEKNINITCVENPFRLNFPLFFHTFSSDLQYIPALYFFKKMGTEKKNMQYFNSLQSIRFHDRIYKIFISIIIMDIQS